MKTKKNLLPAVLLFSLAILLLPIFAGAQEVTIESMAENIVEAVLYVAGAIVIVFWIITGLLFLIALGAPEKLGTAKKALLFAVIGTIVCLLAGGAIELISNVLTTGT